MENVVNTPAAVAVEAFDMRAFENAIVKLALLNEEIERDAEHLLTLRFHDAIANAPLRLMTEVALLERRDVVIDPGKNYTELGVRSFYKGTFHQRTVPGTDFLWQNLCRVQTGDLIFSNIMAWEQAIAIAQSKDNGCVGNHRMLTCEANANLAVPGFLWYTTSPPMKVLQKSMQRRQEQLPVTEL